jgi:hypothetical protein
VHLFGAFHEFCNFIIFICIDVYPRKEGFGVMEKKR